MSYHNTIVYSVWISMILSFSIIVMAHYSARTGTVADQYPGHWHCFFLCQIGTPIGKYRITFFAFSWAAGFRVGQLLSRGT